MRLHVVALPHTQVTRDFCGCAYTAKVLKFCKMVGKDHEILLYAPEGPDVEGARLISCLSNKQRLEIFGPDDASKLPTWPSTDQARLFNLEAAIALTSQQIKPGELILLTGGATHKLIADLFPNAIVAEPGVGYEGFISKYCAFESYAWQHYCYGKNGIQDGRWFDAVIPNFFDEDDFPHVNHGNGKYLLFLGRLIGRKGPQIAAEIATHLGLELMVAGAGAKSHSEDLIIGEGVEIKGSGNLNYIGPVGVEKRSLILAGAKAVIVPTAYIEPFGGVAVEAMMAGTPVITSDFGAFTETVQHGSTGFRFRTFRQAIEAVNKVSELEPQAIRRYALDNYSLDAVRPMYNEWFGSLASLQKKGWYEI